MKNWTLYRQTAIDKLRATGVDVGDGVSASKLGRLCARQLGFTVVGRVGNGQGRRLARQYAEREAPDVVKDPVAQREAQRQAFYRSEGWRRVRYQVLKEHGGRCQCCGRSASEGVTLHVDHIKPKSKFPELALDPRNLQVLCDDCNLGKSNTDATDWRPKLVVNND